MTDLLPEDRDFVVRLRRDLHRHPELAFEEHRTAERVAALLGKSGLEVRTGLAGTGVLGVLRGEGAGDGAAGRTLLIRADMDALPVDEVPGREYGSLVPGAMHASGHDGHTAMAVAAARVLARRRASLPGNVVFAFQPAEETTGGAALMIQEGALLDPSVDAGRRLPPGQHPPRRPARRPAGADHGGDRRLRADDHRQRQPRRPAAPLGRPGGDQLPDRERPANPHDPGALPAQPAVLTVGAIHGGTAGNVIADSVELRGTLRTYDPRLRTHLKLRVEEMVAGIAAAMRAGAALRWDEGYPPTVNDPRITALMQRAIAGAVGTENLVEHEPSLGGDDMAYFLAAVPGCYVRLGSANPARGLDGPAHSARFDFDEDALAIGVDVLVRAALDFLATPPA